MCECVCVFVCVCMYVRMSVCVCVCVCVCCVLCVVLCKHVLWSCSHQIAATFNTSAHENFKQIGVGNDRFHSWDNIQTQVCVQQQPSSTYVHTRACVHMLHIRTVCVHTHIYIRTYVLMY